MSGRETTSSLTSAELEAQTGEPLPPRDVMSLLSGSTGTFGFVGTGDTQPAPMNPPDDMGVDYAATPHQYDLFQKYYA